MRHFFFVAFFGFTFSFFSQENAFIVYTSNGKKSSVKALKKHSEFTQFVFFGEFHDNPISHWLELELTKGYF